MLIPIAHAQNFTPGAAALVGLRGGLPSLIVQIINTALLLVGVVALGFLVYGGFKYITAQGDETQIDTAKRILAGAVIGIVVIGIAAAIVNFVILAVLS